MVKNKHKKPASVLVLILIVVVSISLTLMASIKVITKSHTRYTTGKSFGNSINTNKAKGRFICYKDTNGKLTQRTIIYNPDGSIKSAPELNELKNGNCLFTIPSSVSEYKVTLVGGGASGGLPCAQNEYPKVDTSGDDAIIVGENKVIFKELFKNQSEKYRKLANTYVYGNIYNENKYESVNGVLQKLKVRIATPKQGKNSNDPMGSTSYACITTHENERYTAYPYNVSCDGSKNGSLVNDYLIKKTLNYGTKRAEKNYENYINLEKKESPFYAYVKYGSNEHRLYSSLPFLDKIGKNPSECFYSSTDYQDHIRLVHETQNQNDNCCYIDGTYHNLKGVGQLVSNIDGQTDVREQIYDFKVNPSEKLSLLFLAEKDKNSDYQVGLNSAFQFSLQKNLVYLHQGLAGEPGEVVSFKTSHLTNNASTLAISANKIGNGGAGKSLSASEKKCGTAASRIGNNGGNTSLTLITPSGTTTYTAKGGIGNGHQFKEELEWDFDQDNSTIEKPKIIMGENGKEASFEFHSDFELQNYFAGVAAGDEISTIEKATLPGSSGAGSTLAWQPTKATSYKNFQPLLKMNNVVLTNAKENGETSMLNSNIAFKTTSGVGAPGAIIIEWGIE